MGATRITGNADGRRSMQKGLRTAVCSHGSSAPTQPASTYRSTAGSPPCRCSAVPHKTISAGGTSRFKHYQRDESHRKSTVVADTVRLLRLLCHGVCMRLLATLALIVALGALPALSEARGGGHSSHSSGTHYSGSRHTTTHGGHYAGGKGSSHKGGQYKNPKTADHYGHHK